jgi:hypothetical protein
MKWVVSFPRTLRLDVSLAAMVVLLLLQLLTGTDLEFAELTFLAFFFAVLGVNFAGGLRTLAGWCVAVIALKMFLISQIAKVCYGEPCQSNLELPLVTMGVITVSMAFICLAALVTMPFRWPRVILSPVLDLNRLNKITIISLCIGTGGLLAAQFIGVTEEGAVQLGGLPGLLRRISSCAPLAIVAGTAYTIRASQGRRLLSLYNGIPFAAEFGMGVLFTSKQALFEPFLFVALTGIAFGFAWRRVHLLTGVCSILIAFFVLFPFGQVTRNYTRGANIRETYKKTVEYLDQNLRNPNFLADQYAEYREGVEDDKLNNSYFKRPNGLLERLALIKPADMLISATYKQGIGGWETIDPAFEDMLPRLILPRRYVDVPNILGVRAGMIDEANTGTDVAFGFAAHAFYAFGWTGVAVSSLLLGVMLIVVTRLITSELPGNVWALLLLGGYQHSVAEGNVGSLMGLLTYAGAWLVGSLLCVKVLTEIWCLADKVRALLKPATTKGLPRQASLEFPAR